MPDDALKQEEPLEAINIFDPALLKCPFPFYARLRAEAPVFRDPATGIVQVSKYELICEAARDAETFSSSFGHMLHGTERQTDAVREALAKGYPEVDTMLTADPPIHTRYRKLVNKAFMGKRVNEMEGDITRLANTLIDGFIDKGEVELSSQFAQLLPLRVISEQLGVSVEDLAKFRRWSTAFVTQLSLMADEAGQIESANHIVEFQHYFAAKLEEKRANPTDDIISDLATVTLSEEGDPRPLNTSEALSIIQQLLVAGNETTSHSIVEGMKLAIETPGAMAALRADPSLIPNWVEETLRILTPTQNMWRVATRDTELGGVAIPAGALVMLRYGSGNRDGEVFADGETFDIRRANARRHIAFGNGIHTCIGAPLARKEMHVAFTALLARVKDWRFAPGKNDFAHFPSALLYGMKALHLEFTPA